MGNNSKSSVVYQGKIPGRVKYTFAFGALGKDLIYGMIVDNTRSRFGKFVPWLVIGTLINAFVFVTVFTDFHLTGVKLCVFATVVYILWGMTYTIMDIPYWSVIPNLTSDPQEREKVSVLPRIFASIGQSLIIAGFGVQIIKGLGGDYTGYHRFALIIAATFIFTMAVCVINLPKIQHDVEEKDKMKFKDLFTVIKKNDQLRWAVLLILLYNIGIQAFRHAELRWLYSTFIGFPSYPKFSIQPIGLCHCTSLLPVSFVRQKCEGKTMMFLVSSLIGEYTGFQQCQSD